MERIKECYNYAIRLISQRDYSRHKITQKLKLKGFSPEEYEPTIEKLIEQNYLREADYRRIRIRQLLARGYSNSFILSKTHHEHLDVTNDEIEGIKAEYELNDSEQIEELIQKKIRNIEIPEEFEQRQKLKNKVFRFLISKGHRYDQFKTIIDKYI